MAKSGMRAPGHKVSGGGGIGRRSYSKQAGKVGRQKGPPHPPEQAMHPGKATGAGTETAALSARHREEALHREVERDQAERMVASAVPQAADSAHRLPPARRVTRLVDALRDVEDDVAQGLGAVKVFFGSMG